MHSAPFVRWLLPASLSLLAACTQTPSSVSLDEDAQSHCPLTIYRGQELMLSLRSNPSTGFRWEVKDAASGVLKSLGPEVYSNPEDLDLVGSAGQSTWRYKADKPGNGHLLMVYRRPWEADVAPAQNFVCPITVE
ncbi:MAG: protease inhibitor I42 family protein [Pseudomonas sp.]|uniref:protease inhibitor I42 family protein n=1 Tax=Pseudomonas sp. TaxID=306 RepID=UPI002733C1AB|nr:protease inhibitor I42 family protein [Pseudomonas sp.]MDP3847402.1 protease inhibitor I42 family protein [Pseudomonas sp.]